MEKKKYDLNRPWLTLDPWQKKYIETPPEVDCFLLCPRQIGGKTTAMSIKSVELCIKNFKEGEIVLVNCITERQAMLTLKKAQIYAEAKYPQFICKDKDNKPTMHRLMFKSGKLNKGILCYAAGEEGDSTRGYTIKKLMIDEGARMKEAYFVSALPTLSLTKGSIDIASTPFGKKDREGNEKFFYKCFKDDSFKKFIINLEDCPRRDEEMIEKMRKRLSATAFAQEYLNVFTDDILRLFDDDLIEKACKIKKSDIKEKSKASRWFLGVDVAGFGKDESAHSIIEKLPNKQIVQRDFIIENGKLTTQTTNKILQLNKIYPINKIGVDDGGIGFGVFSELMSNDRTKRKTEALNNASRIMNKEEKRKKLLKEEMYFNLLTELEHGRLFLLNDEDIKASLASVIYENEKIYASYNHPVESLIRAVWLATKGKDLNIFIHSF